MESFTKYYNREIQNSEKGRDICATDIIRNIIDKPISEEEYSLINEFYKTFVEVGFLKAIDKNHFYDTDDYDFYFNITGVSENIRVILKRNIASRVLKYRLLEFIIYKKIMKR